MRMDKDYRISDLTKEQLFALVQVRGQAIQFDRNADAILWERLATSTIEPGDFEKFKAAKDKILADMATAEEKILAGQASSQTN